VLPPAASEQPARKRTTRAAGLRKEISIKHLVTLMPLGGKSIAAAPWRVSYGIVLLQILF
jgi:hypothetical protein